MTALSNKVAIVTGASSGIGYEAAKLFSKEGAKVIVAARREKELNALVEEITSAGGEAVALAGDIQDENYSRALVEIAEGQFGGLDVAFNNAGTLGAMGDVSDITAGGWEETINTNLTSAFFSAKYQVPAMRQRGGGAIVFTSTFVGYTAGLPQTSAYAASKSGLIGLTMALAAECGPDGIRINALLPGGTDTPMGRVMANTPEALAAIEGIHILGRLSKPEEMAQSALFLLSDASSFTTGTALVSDGGVSIKKF